ncbi:hypothetical protein Patl1_32970 [Pistacia atlantica]|uniref:Uncharacterized protein n=1 Tax=Pistacia atlantica TaxID=434234 RepID=A0ACC1AN06_9ROSI|nr:hypothetical protein Patl1_32970 [Pistacia atlantica]
MGFVFSDLKNITRRSLVNYSISSSRETSRFTIVTQICNINSGNLTIKFWAITRSRTM